jgi:hypothetical protein
MDEEELKLIMMDDATTPKPYIISARSNMRFRWDVLIILFAI